MSELTTDPDFLLGVLDHLSVGVFVVSDQGLIKWSNERAVEVFGYTRSEVIGQNVFDFLDPDWDPRAIDSIATAISSSGLRTPMLFRVRHKDGTTAIAEVTANVQFQHSDIGAMVCCIRPWDEKHQLDLTLEVIAGSNSIEESLTHLIGLAESETLEASAAIRYQSHDGNDWNIVHSTGLPNELHPLSNNTDPAGEAWSSLLSHQGDRVHNTSDLPRGLRELATRHGFESLWICSSPTEEQSQQSATVVAWREERSEDSDQTRHMMMQRLARLTGMIIEREHSAIRLHQAATHDSLTGMSNRVRFSDALSDAAKADSRRGKPGQLVGVVFLDLDGFKPINDRYGHITGDRVLVEVAQRIRNVVDPTDLTARVGGDEFAILRPRLTDISELEELGFKLIEEVSKPLIINDRIEVAVGMSIGVVVDNPGACEADELVDAADNAMYHAKAAGGGVRSAPRPSETGEYRRPNLP